MTATNADYQYNNLRGADVYGPGDEKIGTVGQVYTADASGRPAWASVHTGLFGLKESMVPLQDAQFDNDRVQVPFDKAMVKGAPNVDVDEDEPLVGDQVVQLYQYYNLGWDTQNRAGSSETGTTTGTHAADRSPDDVAASGHSANQGDGMTRSEERLNVGTEAQRTGTARLRKHVVTENVQTTVPVQREEVRLEREPITDANRGAATSGPDITESEHEVTLHAEQPVVQKETVPVERVHLGKDTVTEQQNVGGEVRKERIEADLPDEDGRRPLA
jgi:uncharacterized protein (TIGR02271 family)